jgi:diamine N-acetyltransferase
MMIEDNSMSSPLPFHPFARLEKMTSLTVNYVHETIDQVLQSQELPTEQAETTTTLSAIRSSFEWRRVVNTQGDFETIDKAYKIKFGDTIPTLVSTLSHKIPFYFGIQSTRRRTEGDDSTQLAAVCMFYLAYSTWDGRMLNVDQFLIFEKNDWCSDEVLELYQILAKIAVQLQCTRLSWKVRKTTRSIGCGSFQYCYVEHAFIAPDNVGAPFFPLCKEHEKPRWTDPNHPPEFLLEWLFLEMDQPAMTSFLEISNVDPKVACSSVALQGSPLNREHVEHVIQLCLRNEVAPGNRSPVTFRLAGPDDVETISHLVHQLAIYEKEPDAVNVSSTNYLVDGCSASEEPLFYCILADVPNEDEGVVTCGMGVFFFGHVLEEGRFLYLEDLFIEEAYRGMGGGKAIMERLALISLALDCCKFTWAALDWNTPALNFYQKIGATLKDELKLTRYRGTELLWFAEHGSLSCPMALESRPDALIR